MIQFLQSSAKLSTCYAYIGVALRSALRMGLHRSFNTSFNPIEAETRKRIFWVIRRMDSYVGAMLGLPRFLEDEDIDQEWPAEVDDDYITEKGILPMPAGSISVMSAFNAHTRIVQVLSKICKVVYPIKGTQSGGSGSVTYTVSYSKIRELEQDLSQWLDELPSALKPGGAESPLIIRQVQLEVQTFAVAKCLQCTTNATYGVRPCPTTALPTVLTLRLTGEQGEECRPESICLCIRVCQRLTKHYPYFHRNEKEGRFSRSLLVLDVHDLFRNRLDSILCAGKPNKSYKF